MPNRTIDKELEKLTNKLMVDSESPHLIKHNQLIDMTSLNQISDNFITWRVREDEPSAQYIARDINSVSTKLTTTDSVDNVYYPTGQWGDVIESSRPPKNKKEDMPKI